MAGKEEELSMEAAGKWMLMPCTAPKSKSMEASEHGPATRFPSKRKAAAGSSYKEGDQLPEGWIDLPSAAGQDDPEAYNLFKFERREAAIDKMLGEAKLSAVVLAKKSDMAPAAAAEAEAGGNKGKFKVPADDVKLILALKRNDLPSIDYLDDLADLYTPEEIAKRRLRHQSDLELFKRIDDDFEEYQKKVRDSVDKYGYFEVDYDYVEARKKKNAWTKAQWAKIIEDVNITVCAPDADQATLGYIEYVDSDDDAEYDDDSEYYDDSESEDED